MDLPGIQILHERPAAGIMYEPRGCMAKLFSQVIKGNPPKEFVLSGGAGTGKTRSACELLYFCLTRFPGCRALMVRKTRAALSESAMHTMETEVLPPDSPLLSGNLRSHRQSYRFANGSELVIGGIDNPVNFMSAQFDIIYVNEATQLAERDWHYLNTRLRNLATRNKAMGWQMLFGDCNPESPHHWIKRRSVEGHLQLLETSQEDNPAIWQSCPAQYCDACRGSNVKDEWSLAGTMRVPCSNHGRWTPSGLSYIQRLDSLPPLQRARLRFGKWVQAEGVVYPEWDRRRHIIKRFDPPYEWPRYWSIDFGYNNPFVWLAAAMDPDGVLYIYRELYMSSRLVEDHAKQIRLVALAELGDAKATQLFRLTPKAVICDHDREGRATLERYLGVHTVLAKKEPIRDGIQAVQLRLRGGDNGVPRLFVMEGSLIEVDKKLEFERKPVSLVEEFDSYIEAAGTRNANSLDKNRREDPVKENDHGMDALRYLVAHFDVRPQAKWSPRAVTGGVQMPGNPMTQHPNARFAGGGSGLGNPNGSLGNSLDNPAGINGGAGNLGNQGPHSPY